MKTRLTRSESSREIRDTQKEHGSKKLNHHSIGNSASTSKVHPLDRLKADRIHSATGLGGSTDISEHRYDGNIQIRNATTTKREEIGHPDSIDRERLVAGPNSVRRFVSTVTATGGQALPHRRRIVDAFEPYEIGSIRAHIGSRATDGAQLIGARAFATDRDLVFASASPDLRTVAHEVTHVLHQRAGIVDDTGITEADDQYERHAERVASAVVRGHPVAPILSDVIGSPTTVNSLANRPSSPPIIQRKIGFEFQAKKLWVKEFIDEEWETAIDQVQSPTYNDIYQTVGRDARVLYFHKETIHDNPLGSNNIYLNADHNTATNYPRTEMEIATKPYDDTPTGFETMRRELSEKIIPFFTALASKAPVTADSHSQYYLLSEFTSEFSPQSNAHTKTLVQIPHSVTIGPQVTASIRLDNLWQWNEESVPKTCTRFLYTENDPIDVKSTPRMAGLVYTIRQYIGRGLGYYGGIRKKLLPTNHPREPDVQRRQPLKYLKQIGDGILAHTTFAEMFQYVESSMKDRYREKPLLFVYDVLRPFIDDSQEENQGDEHAGFRLLGYSDEPEELSWIQRGVQSESLDDYPLLDSLVLLTDAIDQFDPYSDIFYANDTDVNSFEYGEQTNPTGMWGPIIEYRHDQLQYMTPDKLQAWAEHRFKQVLLLNGYSPDDIPE